MTQQFDIIIVGAGMAGASLAAEIGGAASVLLIEAEEQPGYHSTGRSAAFWSETYGGPLIQPLTAASRAFLASPPPDFCERPFLSPRGAIHVAGGDAGKRLLDEMEDAFSGSVRLERVTRADLVAQVPGLRAGWDEGLSEPSCRDIDVAALHGAYLKRAQRSGVQRRTSARLLAAERTDGVWTVTTVGGEYRGCLLVNAAGAWADEVSRLCGAQPLSIQPYRRTVVQLQVDPAASHDMPLMMDAEGGFYLKPEAGGRLWLSPHDETPCPAGDCWAEEMDIAIAIDRFERFADWRIVRVERSWAGLRSFAPDRLPVYGFDTGRDGFFWFAGQGGFGIQTAPAAAMIAASLLLGRQADPMVAHIDARSFSPARFSKAADPRPKVSEQPCDGEA